MPTESGRIGRHPDNAGADLRLTVQTAMASAEPPIRPGIIGGALRDARRIRRRRRLAGAGTLAAIVPALVIGITALQHGPRAEPAHRGGSVAAGAARASLRPIAAPARRVVAARPYPFVRPSRPAAASLADPVPITAQSLGQLLIDVLPAGASYSQVMASVGAAASETGLSLANFDEVTTAQGTGSVTVQLIRASKPGPEFNCGAEPAGESCITYRPGGGVEVNETVINDAWEIGSTMLAVTAYRPGTGLISIEENSTSVIGPSAGNALPPLTLGQLVRAALDPRWGFTIEKKFLATASRLQVGAANQG